MPPSVEALRRREAFPPAGGFGERVTEGVFAPVAAALEAAVV